jgi:hypothetical protein
VKENCSVLKFKNAEFEWWSRKWKRRLW